MEVHLLFLCLASFLRVVWTEEAEPCDLNEDYLDCGSPCPLTCKNYQDTVFCNKQCTKGCFCKPGYVKGPDRKCILPQNCPIGPCLANENASQCISPCNDCFHRGKCLKEYCSHGCDCISGYFRNSTGLCVLASQCDVKESQCPIHEHFVSCVNLCNDCWSRGDCEQPYCQPGCDCLPGYFRNDEGDCIPESQCIASVGCGLNEEYSDCVVPCNDCEHRGNCDHHCEYGCDCKSGYYRNKQGVCVPAAECSKNAVEARGCRSCGYRCKDDEQFYICVPTCRTTCANFRTPERQCSPFCTPGCFCKTGLVRNYDGHCIPPKECPEMCPLYEEYSDCGSACPVTCSSLGYPVTCMQRCARGCFCIHGYVRGPRGNCIKPEFCPKNCKVNEEYKGCGPSCPKTCGSVRTSALCDSRCVKGCFCRDGYVRGPDGTCILPAFCPVVCPENEVYQQCGRSCQVNCRNLATSNAPCPQPCIRGCFCRRGYVRGPNGRCIPPERCPPVCKEYEVYKECGTPCQTSCDSLAHPNTICKVTTCVQGCFCRDGFVRGPRGDCIRPDQCPSVCKENEEFQECGRACQATCDNRNVLNSPCPLRCIKGCFCKRGFVRGPGDTCIPPNRCPVGCMENEEFKECGPPCPEECEPRNNTRPCNGPCVRGCFCKSGFVRAPNGRCVRPQFCQVCRADEIFRLCGSACPANCTNQNSERECNNDCVPGCFCKDGLVRGPNGRCIPIRQCSQTCRENEVYQECGRPCHLTCDNITRSGAPCPLPCTKGCFCRKGFVRGPDGRCIRPNQCPITCMENEEFKECGPACTANCTNRDPPRFCNLRCLRGCFCKDGLIRGPNGRCISPVLCPERCRENEEFKECGSACPASCTNRMSERVCTLQCIRSCFCRDGFIRGPNGRCILPERCPPTCPTNEEFKECGTACPANCSYPNGVRECTRECVRGCFCRLGLIRGPNGTCIPPQQCPRPCNENEVFKDCGSPCQITCSNLNTTTNFACVNPCISGCFCRDGFVRGPGGRCIPTNQCPVVQDCKPNEVYKQCGSACPSNCTNRNSEQRCPLPCVPGCSCRNGFVRGPTGNCIPKEQCPQTPCPKPNERFLECGPSCIRTCPRIEYRRNCPQRCIRGCFCNPRFVRDIDGNCVRPQDCPRDPQRCPNNEQFLACKPCLRTCDSLNSRRTCSNEPCRPGCDCRKGYYRNRQGTCVSPRSCLSLQGRRGGNETEGTSELIFTDVPTVLTTPVPPLSTASITNGETSRYITLKPLDITTQIGSSPSLEILPRRISSAPLDITTKTPSSIPLDTKPGIGGSTPLETTPGIGSPKPSDTTPGIGSSAPLETTPGIGSPKPSDTTPGIRGSAPLETTPGIGSPKPSDTTPGIGSSAPLETTPGIGSPKPSDKIPGIASSKALDTTLGIGISTESSTTIEKGTIPTDILARKLSIGNQQPDITSPASGSSIGFPAVSTVVPKNIITTISELISTDITSKHSLGPLKTTPKVTSGL